jgi:uncharacterized membrane protein
MRWENSVDIEAPASRVWQLTEDVESWPTMTPTITSVKRVDGGPLRIGSQARIKQPAQSLALWTVTELEPGRRFTWATRRMGLTMVGSHAVTGGGGACRNTLTLDVEGRGSRVFGLLFGALMRRTLATENAGFKRYAEQDPTHR